MNIIVLLRMVPDVVEELEIAPDGKALDADLLRMVLSETDDHALEEALLLKEHCGGAVTALAIDAPEIDDTLYAALAKGVDKALKIVDVEPGLSARTAASLFGAAIRQIGPADLILTGGQALDDLDGLIAPLVAHQLGMPYFATVTQIVPDAAKGKAAVIREYPGGFRGQFDTPLPAVLGIQAAEKPPRYVPVAKVRATMKAQKLETAPAAAAGSGVPVVEVIEMAKPAAAGHAEMLEGEPEEVVDHLCEVLAGRGLL